MRSQSCCTPFVLSMAGFQQLTCALDWQRHEEAVCEFEPRSPKSFQPPRIRERPAIAFCGLCREIGFCKEREKGLSPAQPLLGCGRTVIRP
jgi:hypothetical protein